MLQAGRSGVLVPMGSLDFFFKLPQHTPERPSSEPHGATRQQAIAKTPAKLSVYQIQSVIVVFVALVFKV
jgi:hypothetical protein